MIHSSMLRSVCKPRDVIGVHCVFLIGGPIAFRPGGYDGAPMYDNIPSWTRHAFFRDWEVLND